MNFVPTRSTVDAVEISLPGNRALRLSLTRDPSGAPDRLTIQSGWSALWRDDGRRVELFGDAIEELRAALDALLGTAAT